MALTDTLSGDLKALIELKLRRTGGGGHTGVDVLSRKPAISLTDGTGSNQAIGWFSSTFTATTSGVTISLADSSDPLGAAGDDAPTCDPEGTDLRLLMIENLDDTNYITIEKGTNGVSFLGTTPGIKVPPGGVFFLMAGEDGLGPLNDGSNDEIKITANTADCSVAIDYVFG